MLEERKILLLFTRNQETTELNQRANGVHFASTINYRGQWIPSGHIKFTVIESSKIDMIKKTQATCEKNKQK